VKGDVIDVSLIRTTLVELGNWFRETCRSGTGATGSSHAGTPCSIESSTT
jgi:hypothetical protein